MKGARPAPLLELAAIAATTSRLLLGTTSLLLPIRHPLLLAEELAVLDRLAEGRLIVGLGRGFRPELFSAFGVDVREKRTLFESSVAALLAAWQATPERGGEGQETVATRGAAPPISQQVSRAVVIDPSPRQRPHPPLWVAAFGPRAIEQAARLGLPYLASPLESWATIVKNHERHGEIHRRQTGREPVAVPVMRTVFASEDDDLNERVREALAAERRSWRETAGLGSLLGEVEGANVDEASGDRSLGDRASDDWAWVGKGSQVAERIARARETTGMTHLIVRSPLRGASREVVERSLRTIRTLTS